MIDTLIQQLPRLRRPAFWETLNLAENGYFILTLHRPSNVDGHARLVKLLHAVNESVGDVPVIFPVHPRTAKIIDELGLSLPGIHFIEPLGYLEFIYLLRSSKGVVTDSGGVTEETTYLNIPCLTMRDNTERPETVSIGTNQLIGADIDLLREGIEGIIKGRGKQGAVPEKWDGRAAERIVELLPRLLRQS